VRPPSVKYGPHVHFLSEVFSFFDNPPMFYNLILATISISARKVHLTFLSLSHFCVWPQHHPCFTRCLLTVTGPHFLWMTLPSLSHRTPCTRGLNILQCFFPYVSYIPLLWTSAHRHQRPSSPEYAIVDETRRPGGVCVAVFVPAAPQDLITYTLQSATCGLSTRVTIALLIIHDVIYIVK